MAPEPSEERARSSLAVLVLGCASSPYDETIAAIRQTWASVRTPGVDVYFVYGVPQHPGARSTLAGLIGAQVHDVEPDAIAQFGDVLIAGCADAIKRQVDCLLRKRLIAFDHLTRAGAYDWLYTCCATSYVGLDKLLDHAVDMPRRPFVSGALSIDPKHTTPFASGASMLLTADIAASLGRDRYRIIEGNQYGHADDVTIGHWVATHYGDLTPEIAVRHLIEGRALPADYVFIQRHRTTRDFVMAPADEHVPAAEAFHYHFHSRKPNHIRRFHEKYLAAASGACLPRP